MAIKVAGTTVIDDSRVLQNLGSALTVGNGGTGATSLTANSFLFGAGTSAITATTLLGRTHGVTTGDYVRAIGFADTVTALGNTGTAMNIDIVNGGVFTATLTGNCTFTLRYPVATGASSFALVLTNDGSSGRTVAWSGGTFIFAGGAALLNRTTSASGIDVWVFFTTNAGSTYFGNIAMRDVKA